MSLSSLCVPSGTTTLLPIGKLGIYWESYGIALGGTVDVAVWIARADEPVRGRRPFRILPPR